MNKLRTTSQSSYTAYHSNGAVIISNVSSPFRAIGKATEVGDYVKELDTNTVIFQRSTTPTFYKFQFTNYYGSTHNETEAENWAYNFQYSHIINNNGEFCYNNYTLLTGSHSLLESSFEPQSGGYLYNFSYDNWGYKSAVMNIDLSMLKIKFSNTSTNNAYIYLAAIAGNSMIEVGIRTYPSLVSGNTLKWRYYIRRISWNGHSYPWIQGDLTTALKNNDYFSGGGNITVKLSMLPNNNPGIYYEFYRNGTRQAYDSIDMFPESQLTSDNNITFLSAVSFVPDLTPDGISLGDLRNGAYMKSAKIESYLYTDLNQTGNKHGFTATSDPSLRSMAYNDDTATYSRSGNFDIVDIDYSKPYQQ